MKRILLLSLLLVSSFGFAQQPTIEWQDSYGGSGGDWANSMQRTTDGGYIVSGNTLSNDGDVTGNSGSYDFWVVKLDASGSLTWQKTLGGSGFEQAVAVRQTTDGGYIVAGLSGSTDGDVTGNNGAIDFWVVKLDGSGNISWEKSLGGSQGDYGTSIDETTDGGYIVAGYSESSDGDLTENNGAIDYWVVKLDISGNILWERSLGGSGDEFAYSVHQTVDGGYIVAGNSDSNDGDITGNNGGDDYWVVKLDATGNTTWERSLGGSGIDSGSSVKQSTDGGYIVVGYTDSNDGDVTGNNGDVDAWIVKLDVSGNITWEKALGGSGADRLYESDQTTDGGHVLIGYSESIDGDVTGNNGLNDYWVVKINGSGNLLWQKTMGGSGDDEGNSIKQTTDGGFIVAGFSESNDGDVSGNNGNEDYWVVKLGPDSSVDELTQSKIKVYPNPGRNEVTISIDAKLVGKDYTITDNSGRVVKEDSFNSIEQKVDLSKFNSGVYFLKTHENDQPVKIIKR